MAIPIGCAFLMAGSRTFAAIRPGRGGRPRDMAVRVLAGMAAMLVVVYLIAAAGVACWGMAYLEVMRASLVLTAGFAAAGVACGLVRSLRHGGSIGRFRDLN